MLIPSSNIQSKSDICPTFFQSFSFDLKWMRYSNTEWMFEGLVRLLDPKLNRLRDGETLPVDTCSLVGSAMPKLKKKNVLDRILSKEEKLDVMGIM